MPIEDWVLTFELWLWRRLNIYFGTSWLCYCTKIIIAYSSSLQSDNTYFSSSDWSTLDFLPTHGDQLVVNRLKSVRQYLAVHYVLWKIFVQNAFLNSTWNEEELNNFIYNLQVEITKRKVVPVGLLGVCDVILIVEHEDYYVHKELLTDASPVFKVMLESEIFRDKKLKKIELPGKKGKDILQLLNCLYPHGSRITGIPF